MSGPSFLHPDRQPHGNEVCRNSPVSPASDSRRVTPVCSLPLVRRATAAAQFFRTVRELDSRSGTLEQTEAELQAAWYDCRRVFTGVTDDRLRQYDAASLIAKPYILSGLKSEAQSKYVDFAFDAARRNRHSRPEVHAAVDTVLGAEADGDFQVVLRVRGMFQDLAKKAAIVAGASASSRFVERAVAAEFRRLHPLTSWDRWFGHPKRPLVSVTRFSIVSALDSRMFDNLLHRATGGEVTARAFARADSPFVFTRGPQDAGVIDHERWRILLGGMASHQAPAPYPLLCGVATAIRDGSARLSSKLGPDGALARWRAFSAPLSATAVLDGYWVEIAPQLRPPLLDSVSLVRDESTGEELIRCAAEALPLATSQPLLTAAMLRTAYEASRPYMALAESINQAGLAAGEPLLEIQAGLVRLALKARSLGAAAEDLLAALPMYANLSDYITVDIIYGRLFGDRAGELSRFDELKVAVEPFGGAGLL
jgi:hypothetical protein